MIINQKSKILTNRINRTGIISVRLFDLTYSWLFERRINLHKIQSSKGIEKEREGGNMWKHLIKEDDGHTTE